MATRYINDTNLIFGILIILLGFLVILGYLMKNKKILRMQNSFKDKYGDKTGIIYHFLSYVVLPIAGGIFIMIFKPF